MKELETMVSRLKEDESMKSDFVVQSKRLSYSDGALLLDGATKYNPTKIFNEQVCESLNIPKGYFERMKDSSIKLLDANVNHWFSKNDKLFLVRTFESEKRTARALLSSRYHMLDNWVVLNETLKSIDELGLTNKIQIAKCSLTDARMYVEFTCPEVVVQATEMLKMYRLSLERGYGVVSGFLLSNSEVGRGKFTITPRAVVLACNNGLIRTNQQLKRIHLGASLDETIDFGKSKSVRDANIRLIREQIKYSVDIFLSKSYLTSLVEYYHELGSKSINAPINKLTKVIADNYGWDEDASNALIARFVTGGDIRRMGIYNAMTDVAQTFEPDEKYTAELAALEVMTSFERFEKLAIAQIQSN